MANDHGRTDKYIHEFMGWNMRLDAIQANIMNKLIIHIDKFNEMRRSIAKLYDQNLKIDTFVKTKNYCENSYYQYTLRVKNRDNLQLKLKENSIPTSIFYPIPLHLQQCFQYLKYKQNDFPISEKASNEVISIPMNPFLTNEQIDYIISYIKENL